MLPAMVSFTPRRHLRLLRTALCIVFMQAALMTAFMYVGRVIELAAEANEGSTAKATQRRQERLTLEASIAGLIALLFGAAALQGLRSGCGNRGASQVKNAEQARADSDRHLKAIADNMPALITYVNTDRVVTFANATFKTWLGADPSVMVGKPLAEVIGQAMYDQRLPYLARGFAGEQLSFEMPVNAQGLERDFKTTYIPDFLPNRTVAGIFVLVTDVTSMRTVERQLHQLARVDTLTQLPNRRHFDERLTEALARARRYDRHMALMFLDIDHFKAINDTHGHAAGDDVLVEFAARLLACVRETDLVARLGGDEFVVLLEGMNSRSEATLVAEKIRAQLQAPMRTHGRQVFVTSSIGIALADESDGTPSAITAKADAALYCAKRSGRDRYAIAGGDGSKENAGLALPLQA